MRIHVAPLVASALLCALTAQALAQAPSQTPTAALAIAPAPQATTNSAQPPALPAQSQEWPAEQLRTEVTEDQLARITEEKRRGRTTRIEVSSKIGAGTYRVVPQTPSTSSNGPSTWRVLSW